MKQTFLLLVILFVFKNAYSQHDTEPKSLVFGGAGALGITYIEAVKLAKINPANIQDYCGTSSGSIMAAGMSMQSIEVLQKSIRDFDFKQCKQLKNLNLLDNGIYSNDGIGVLLEKIGIEANMDFEQHFELTQKNLYIVATLRRKGKEDSTFVFSRLTTPFIKIHDAIKASTAIEYYFEPLFFRDSTFSQITTKPTDFKLLDGNITNNYAFDVLLERGVAATDIVGFYVETTKPFSRLKGLLALIADLKGRKTDKRVKTKIRNCNFLDHTIFIPSMGEKATIHTISPKTMKRFEKIAFKGVFQNNLDKYMDSR